MARCLIGCGSNLGSRRDQLDHAIELLRFFPGIRLGSVSRYRETLPVGGPPGQDPYLNAACVIDTDLVPTEVLAVLASIEKTLHRERGERWGARTIDLDLLLYGDSVIDTPALTLPHPRMATRRFVLEPSAEVAGDFPVPNYGCTIRDLLDNISEFHPLVAVVGIPGSGASEVTSAVADAVIGRSLHAGQPIPLAAGGPPASLACWQHTLAAWYEPLARDAWNACGGVTIADFWCGSLLAAAEEELCGQQLDVLRADADALASRSVAPHVAIMLVVTPAAIEERIAFRARCSGAHSDIFRDLAPSTVALAASGDRVEALIRLQDRLLDRLRAPDARSPHTPKATVVVAADDLGRAVAEATAAVEAML